MRSRITSSVPLRRLVQVGVDAGLIGLAYYLAFTLRFDAGIPARYEDLLVQTVGFVVLMKLCLFALFGLYSKLWRFVDQADFESIVKAVVVASFVLIGALFLLSPTKAAPPRGVIALDFLPHARARGRRALSGAGPGGAPAARAPGPARRPRARA